MKISPTLCRPTSSAASVPQRSPVASAAPQPSPRHADDSTLVAISTVSRQLLALQQHPEQHGDDVDTARVQALRAAIAAGELQIDSGRIADGLVASVGELLQVPAR